MNLLPAFSPAIAACRAGLRDAALDEDSVSRYVKPLFARALADGGNRIYLANHSLGRALDQTETDVLEGLDHWYRLHENAWPRWLDEIAAFRRRIAALIGAPRFDCVVPRASAGQGLRCLLNTCDRPLRVVTSADEFTSIDHILKHYALRGRISLVRAAPGAGRLYRSEDFLGPIRRGADLVVVSHVMFTTGQCLPELPSLIEAAHRSGARVLLDVYHAAGALPLNMATLDADFAVGGCYKYLRGGPGAGWFYLHPRHLDGALDTLDTGWFAEPDPFAFKRPAVPAFAAGGDRFLESTPAVLPFYQARAGLEFVLAVGIDRLRRYSLRQQGYVEALLTQYRIPFLGNAEERGAFISIPHARASVIAERLLVDGIVCDAREGLLRVCPDLLNTEAEMEMAVEKLAPLINA